MDEGNSEGRPLNEIRCEEAEGRITSILRELKMLEKISQQQIECIAVEYRKQVQLRFLPESEEREWIKTIGIIMCDRK